MPRRDATYQPSQPTPEDVQRMPGPVLLDFGTDWCGHCSAARAAVERWLDAHPDIAHLRIEDGRGRPLGRAFRVKLWPTLVLLCNGSETARIVRPRSDADLSVLNLAMRSR
jgi:thioredoxin 1